MDEFSLEIATANEDLVKLLRTFTNVEKKIDDFDDWSQGLDRLPVQETEEEELDVLTVVCVVLVALFLPFLYVTAYSLLKRSALWLICKAIKNMERDEAEVKDYAKLEESREEKEKEDDGRGRRRRKTARKTAELLGQDLCVVVACLIVMVGYGQTREHMGANTSSAQLFIGNGKLNLVELGDKTERTLQVINQEMFSARNILSLSVETLAKYDPDIQDIILSRIDRITQKGDMIAERASRLEQYLAHCSRKQMVLALSLLYFFCSIGFATFGIRFSLAGLGTGLGASLAYFTLGLISHFIMFVTMFLVWAQMFVPLLTMSVYSNSWEML